MHIPPVICGSIHGKPSLYYLLDMSSIRLSELNQLSESSRKQIFAAIYDNASTDVNRDVPAREQDELIENYASRVESFYQENPDLDPLTSNRKV